MGQSSSTVAPEQQKLIKNDPKKSQWKKCTEKYSTNIGSLPKQKGYKEF